MYEKAITIDEILCIEVLVDWCSIILAYQNTDELKYLCIGKLVY